MVQWLVAAQQYDTLADYVAAIDADLDTNPLLTLPTAAAAMVRAPSRGERVDVMDARIEQAVHQVLVGVFLVVDAERDHRAGAARAAGGARVVGVLLILAQGTAPTEVRDQFEERLSQLTTATTTWHTTATQLARQYAAGHDLVFSGDPRSPCTILAGSAACSSAPTTRSAASSGPPPVWQYGPLRAPGGAATDDMIRELVAHCRNAVARLSGEQAGRLRVRRLGSSGSMCWCCRRWPGRPPPRRRRRTRTSMRCSPQRTCFARRSGKGVSSDEALATANAAYLAARGTTREPARA